MAVGSINDLICNTSQKLVACPHRIGVKMAKKHSMLPEFGVVFQNVWSLRMNLPIPSMYGIFTYIWLNLMVNAGKYTIHIYIVWYGFIWNSLCLSSGQMVTWVCINSRHPNIGRPLVGTTNAGRKPWFQNPRFQRWDFQDLNIEAFQSLLTRRVFWMEKSSSETWKVYVHTCFLKKRRFLLVAEKKTCWRWVLVKFLEIPVFRWGGSQSCKAADPRRGYGEHTPWPHDQKYMANRPQNVGEYRAYINKPIHGNCAIYFHYGVF